MSAAEPRHRGPANLLRQYIDQAWMNVYQAEFVPGAGRHVMHVTQGSTTDTQRDAVESAHRRDTYPARGTEAP